MKCRFPGDRKGTSKLESVFGKTQGNGLELGELIVDTAEVSFRLATFFKNLRMIGKVDPIVWITTRQPVPILRGPLSVMV